MSCIIFLNFPGGSVVKKNPSTRIQETQVWSLVKRALEEKMASHSNIVAWNIPWAEELRAIVHGSQSVRYDWVTEHTGKNYISSGSVFVEQTKLKQKLIFLSSCLLLWYSPTKSHLIVSQISLQIILPQNAFTGSP